MQCKRWYTSKCNDLFLSTTGSFCNRIANEPFSNIRGQNQIVGNNDNVIDIFKSKICLNLTFRPKVKLNISIESKHIIIYLIVSDVFPVCYRLRDVNNWTIHDLYIDLHNGSRSNGNMQIGSQYSTISFVVMVLFALSVAINKIFSGKLHDHDLHC